MRMLEIRLLDIFVRYLWIALGLVTEWRRRSNNVCLRRSTIVVGAVRIWHNETQSAVARRDNA